MGFVLFLVIVLVIAAPIIIKRRKEQREEKKRRESVYPDMESVGKPDMERLKEDGGMIRRTGAGAMPDNHKIYTVLRYRPDANKWICRNCESENAADIDRCPVCRRPR